MGDILTITNFLAEAEAPESVSTLGLFLYLALVLLIIFGLMSYAKKGLGERVFKNWVLCRAEQLYLFIQNLTISIIGKGGEKYVPFIMTFWVVIFFSNLVGLFMPMTPTAVLSFNLGMALISICYVQYEGVRVNGAFGHVKHFFGPKLPIFMAIFLTPIIFSIEVVSELMKNVSLSLRLYGNIHGGHEAVLAMNKLGASIYFPFGSFLMPIKFLTCVVQALIFSLLTCVYISLVASPHDDHGEDGHSGSDGHGAAPGAAH